MSRLADPIEDDVLLDADVETSLPLNGSKAVASPPLRQRKLLVLLPLLAVFGMAAVALATGYLSDDNADGSYSDASSSFTTSAHSMLKNLNTGGNATAWGAPEDGDIVTPHPQSPYYQRGERFDRSVLRDRAVVICMHNDVLAMGLSLIRELRCMGNEELVQVYHCGQDELSAESKEILFATDNRLELVDVCSDLTERGVINKATVDKFKNWWIKPLAVYHTDVRHVMLTDVDDIIVKDPAALRELDGYKNTGTTFFYDRVFANCKEFVNADDNHRKYLPKLFETFDYERFNITEGFAPSEHVLESFGYRGKTCHEMDSSLVLIDKKRAGQTVMDIMLWFITKERFRFRYSWGDKETFWLSYELAHVPYSFSPWGVSVVSSTPNKDMAKHPDSLCGSILQYMPVASGDADAGRPSPPASAMAFFKLRKTEAEKAQQRVLKELERVAKAQRKHAAKEHKAQQARLKQQDKEAKRVEKLQQKQQKEARKSHQKAVETAKKASKTRIRLARKAEKARARRHRRQMRRARAEARRNVAVAPGSVAVPPFSKSAGCYVCGKKFGKALHRRRHHCRQCRESCCLQCTSRTRRPVLRYGLDKPQKVCVVCETLVFNNEAVVEVAAPATASQPREPAEAVVALAAIGRASRRPHSAPLPPTEGATVTMPVSMRGSGRGRARSTKGKGGSIWTLPIRPLLKRKKSAEQLRNRKMDLDLQIDKRLLFRGRAVELQPQSVAPPAP